MELDVQHETNTKKIIARLLREGWVNVGGGNHDKFRKAGRDPVIVPRHSEVKPGVARSIAKSAGWTLKD
jgi:predicted RNA binding protein YcfA (HicA-like mRNA interferase family)